MGCGKNLPRTFADWHGLRKRRIHAEGGEVLDLEYMECGENLPRTFTDWHGLRKRRIHADGGEVLDLEYMGL